MYRFDHYFRYNQQLQRGKSDAVARATGGMLAAMTISIHIVLLLSVIKMILAKYFAMVLQRKDLWFVYPGLMIIFLFYSFWFGSKKRTQVIMDKLVTEKDPTRGSNAIKVIAIIFVPLIVVFILAPKAS